MPPLRSTTTTSATTPPAKPAPLADAPRHDFSRIHRRAYFFLCLLSVVILGCALGLVCGQATYNRGWEYALYVGGTQRTAQWAIANTAILSNADQIALAAWSGVAAVYFVTAVALLYTGRHASRLLRSGVDIAMLLLIGLAGCAILAWTMAYKWSAYAYCRRTFKLEALAICSLAIATIILGWILAGACLIAGFLEALAVSRHGLGWGGLRRSFHRLEAPRRAVHDFAQLTALPGARPRTARVRKPRDAHAREQREKEEALAAMPPPAELRAKLAALQRDPAVPPAGLQVPLGSRSGSEVSSKSARSAKGSASGSGSDGEYASVNTLPWGAPNAAPAVPEVPNALSGEEVLVPAHGGPITVHPPEYAAAGPVLDAERFSTLPARPGRVPVDRGSGYIADGQAGRGVRSPTRFVTDNYTRPVTPPTRRASHQRSLSQANDAAAALRHSTAESTHTRSRSWDYI